MIISYSEVSKIQTCKRQWYYSSVLNLMPIEESDPIATGNRGHKLLQNFYTFMMEGKTKEEALKLTTEIANEEMKKDRFFDKALLKAWTLVDNYVRETDFTSEAILVEERFLVPIERFAPENVIIENKLEGVHIGFTPDLVIERSSKFLDVEDYKFIQRGWSDRKKNRYSQLRLYIIFLELMGYKVSRAVLRMFNVSTGKIDTKPYVLTPIQKSILIGDFTDGVVDLVNYKRKLESEGVAPARTMNYNACQFCAFEFPCTLESEGKSATNTLSSEFVKRNYGY